MKVQPVRTPREVEDAACLMRGLVEANKALYFNDLATIEDYYRNSWFFDDDPAVPMAYRPPNGDVLVAYLDGEPAGTVAIYKMDALYCELKSMFLAREHRNKGVAVALCEAVIELARAQGYRTVRLTTGVRQTVARHLYQRLGFLLATPWDRDPPKGYDYFELDISKN